MREEMSISKGVEEMVSTDKNNMLVCDSIEKLSALIEKDLGEFEITDLKAISGDDYGGYTHIYIFLNLKSEIEMEEMISKIEDPEKEWMVPLENIPYGDKKELENFGVDMSYILKYGYYYEEMIVDDMIGTYMVHLYEVDKRFDDKSNFIIITSIPRDIEIKVDEIMQRKQKEG